MKNKITLIAILIFSISITAFSQHRRGSKVNFKSSGKSEKEVMKEAYAKNNNPERLVELGYTYNYQFGGKTYAYYNTGGYSEIEVSDSDSHAFTLSVPAKWNTRLELYFSNQNTSLHGDRKFDPLDVAIRYYQIGVIKEIPKGKLIPYGAFSLGAVEINTSGNSYDDVWKFAISLGGGLKYYFNPRLGLKLEARMLAPIAYGGLYIGTGGSGVSASSATLQGYIGGGATFAITR